MFLAAANEPVPISQAKLPDLDLVQIFRALSAIEKDELVNNSLTERSKRLTVPTRTQRNLSRTILLLLARKLPDLNWWDRLREMQNVNYIKGKLTRARIDSV